jgi:deoxycytidine triphosphate deaminase
MKGVLPYQELAKLVSTGVIVDADPTCIRTASYDMRIGDEYYLYDADCQNGTEIRRRGSGVISIPPNGLLLCTMHESLKLDADLVGHLSLKITLLTKGIIIASQSQIDAGYEGKIFGLLYNLSQKDVCLKDGEFVLRLELVRMEAKTDRPYDNSISKTATLSRYIDTPIMSSLVQIKNDASQAKKDVDAAKDKLNLIQLFGAIAIALVSLFAGLHFASDSRVDRIEQKVNSLDTKAAVADAASSAKTKMDALEQENLALKKRVDDLDALLKAGRSSAPPPKGVANAETVKPAT